MTYNFHDIPSSSTWTKIQAIHKGWSGEEKYYIKTKQNKEYLLRIADQSKLAEERSLYAIYDSLKGKNLPIPEALVSGYCNNGQNTYRLLTWIKGQDANEIITNLPKSKQFELGLQAGRIQAEFHKLPAPENDRSWAKYYNWKIDRNLRNYHDCGSQLSNDDCFIDYIHAKRQLLEGRPQCFHHGDFHIGNMLVQDSGQLAVIDINRLDYGDPYEEFNRMIWNASASTVFADGLIHGYFSKQVIPRDFFPMMALYICSNLLGGLSWAIGYGKKEVAIIMEQSHQIRKWYANFETSIPCWFNA